MSGSGPTGVILCIDLHSSAIAIRHRCAASEGSQETYERINLLVTLCVVIFDMLKLRSVLERRYVPVQLPQPLMHRRITRSDITDVALEMLHVDRVEANNGGVEANVCLGNVGTKIVRSSMFSKVSLGAVEGGEKGPDGISISFLRSSDGKRVDDSHPTGGWKSKDGERAYVAKPDL